MIYSQILASPTVFSSFFLFEKKNHPYVVTRDVCPSVRLSVCLSVYLSVCPSVVCGNFFGTRLHDN